MHTFMIALLKRRILAITLLLMLTSIAGCTTNRYIPPSDGRVATFSLSSLSKEVPKVNVSFGCEKMFLNSDFIEQRAPDDKVEKRTVLRAGEVATIQVAYENVRRRDDALSNEDGIYASHFLKKTATGFKSCRSTLSFIPEEGGHYEIYFGLVSGRCSVRALQVDYNADDERNEYNRVMGVNRKTCH